MNKKVTIISLIVIGIMIFLTTRINRENLEYTSKYPMLTVSELNEYKGTYVVIVFSTSCSGTTDQFPSIGKKLEALKEKKIPYYLIADEIYNDSLDAKLDEIKNKYHLENETFYLMDVKSFPVNGGLFHNKNRYENFIKGITSGSSVPLGYVNFITISDNKLQSSMPTLTFEEINNLK